MRWHGLVDDPVRVLVAADLAALVEEDELVLVVVTFDVGVAIEPDELHGAVEGVLALQVEDGEVRVVGAKAVREATTIAQEERSPLLELLSGEVAEGSRDELAHLHEGAAALGVARDTRAAVGDDVGEAVLGLQPRAETGAAGVDLVVGRRPGIGSRVEVAGVGGN